MNETTQRIVADAEAKIANRDQAIKEMQEEIESLIESRDKFLAERGELADVIAKLSDKTQKLHSVQWFNTDNLSGKYAAPVVVHGAGCNHIKHSMEDPFVKAGLTEISNVEQWSSAMAFATDYNADFYNEGGNDAAWAIAFFPCTGMVEKLKITTGYDQD